MFLTQNDRTFILTRTIRVAVSKYVQSDAVKVALHRQKRGISANFCDILKN